MTQSVFAPAKVNLFLEVTDKRPDGFHNIDSVFAELDIADELRMRRSETPGVTLEISGKNENIPSDERNLVHKAASRILERVGGGLSIWLEKRIPAGAGLGGGSSDAAAALRLANRTAEAGLTEAELRKIGAELGSDVSFFFFGGVCVCRGRGEIVTPAGEFGKLPEIVVALTGVHCDTAAAYRGLRLPKAGEARRPDDFLAALKTGDVGAMERLAFNRFEETAFAARPELDRLRRGLSAAAGCPVRLSGSGGSLWYFSDNADEKTATAWASENRVKLLSCRLGSTLPGC